MLELKQISGYEELLRVWLKLSVAYNPPLDKKISNFQNYIKKISNYGISFVCYVDGSIGGCVSFYANDTINRLAYITQIATHPNFQGHGIASLLLDKALTFSGCIGMKAIRLEVKKENVSAQRFYLNREFSFDGETKDSFYMIRSINSGDGSVL